MSSSPTPQNTHSPPHPLPASSSSSTNPPDEATKTTAMADTTSPSHGASVIAAENTAPPSISGSTATGTTATTGTSTTMVSLSASGASSTSSPPSFFPPLINHGIAPPQLSVTNANAHPLLAHNHAPPPPNQAVPPASNPSRSPSAIPSTSISSHQNPPGQGQGQNQNQGISTPRQIEEARRAVVASISNLVDRELTGRASQLHSNNAAIEKQEREISKTLDAFRKDNDKLAKLAADHTKKIKEIGNVQNWAEMLEREFLILEETLRLANRPGRRPREGDGEGDEDGESGSWSGSGSYSGSWSGSEAGGGPEGEDGGKEGEGEGVNGAKIQAAPSGEQGPSVSDGDPSAEPTTKAPVLLGKGKEREGDIQLALAEAMETDLVIGVGGEHDLASGPSSSR